MYNTWRYFLYIILLFLGVHPTYHFSVVVLRADKPYCCVLHTHTHTHKSLPPHALPMKYTNIFAVALTVTKLTVFSCSHVASCMLKVCFSSSALLAQVSWSLRNPFFMYYLRGYGFICLFCCCLFMLSFAFF